MSATTTSSIAMEPRSFRPRTWTPLIPFVLSLVMVFGSVYAGQAILGFVGGLLALMSALLFFFLRSSVLTLDAEGIHYRTRLNNRSFAWRSIQRSYIRRHLVGKSPRPFWYFETDNEEKLTLPMHLFAPSVHREIARALFLHCPHVQTDENLAKMRFEA